MLNRRVYLLVALCLLALAGIWATRTATLRPAVGSGPTSPEPVAEPERLTPAPMASPGWENGEDKGPRRIFYRDKVAVLTYHHLDSAESSVTITPERFQSHLQVLADNGFQVIPIEALADFLLKGKPVPPNAVVLTFDDGYESVYKEAFPLLQARGYPAAVFLIVSYVGDNITHIPSILGWDQIEEMHKAGFGFYSHTYNLHDSYFDADGKEHSLLTIHQTDASTQKPETAAAYKKRVIGDLKQADEILNKRLGNQVNMLCLPHGQYTPELLELAKQAQIPILLTGTSGYNGPKDRLVHRINAGSPYMTPKLLLKKLKNGK